MYALEGSVDSYFTMIYSGENECMLHNRIHVLYIETALVSLSQPGWLGCKS